METPDTPVWREILDAIIEYWHAGHGQVASPDGIPEKDLVHGMSVKDLIAGELHANAVGRYGTGTQVVLATDDGYDRVGVIVTGPDGVTKHRGQARAVRDSWGYMAYTDIRWDA